MFGNKPNANGKRTINVQHFIFNRTDWRSSIESKLNDYLRLRMPRLRKKAFRAELAADGKRSSEIFRYGEAMVCTVEVVSLTHSPTTTCTSVPLTMRIIL